MARVAEDGTGGGGMARVTEGWHGWRMRLARCVSPLNSKLIPVGRGYSWMGDHLGIVSC